MKRRDFLASAAAIAAGTSLFSRAVSAGPLLRARRLQRIGLELYAVRNAMKKDPERTLAAVRAIGYTQVELLWSWNNFDRTTAQVKASLKQEGLRAPSAHIAPEILLADWQRWLDTANELGHEYLIVPSLPDEQKMTLDGWRQWADRFNVAGAAARKSGIWLAFHNEPTHMPPIDGQVPYDVFIAHTDPKVVRLQLDTGNMELGGGDPYLYLAKYRDRYWSFHLKDVVADGSTDTELGRGRIDFRKFLSLVPDLDHKPCYVEQEEPADELASARQNFAWLAALDF